MTDRTYTQVEIDALIAAGIYQALRNIHYSRQDAEQVAAGAQAALRDYAEVVMKQAMEAAVKRAISAAALGAKTSADIMENAMDVCVDDETFKLLSFARHTSLEIERAINALDPAQFLRENEK